MDELEADVLKPFFLKKFPGVSQVIVVKFLDRAMSRQY
jgi:hypothetical protein